MDCHPAVRLLSLRCALSCSAFIACSESEPVPPKLAAPPVRSQRPAPQPVSPHADNLTALSAVQRRAQPEIVRPASTPEPAQPSPTPKRPTAEDFRGDLCAYAHFVLTSAELPPREKSPDPPCFSDTNQHEAVQPLGVSHAALTVMCSNPAGRRLDVGLRPGNQLPNCGKQRRICTEPGTRGGLTITYYQFTDGPLKDAVLSVSEWKGAKAFLPPPAMDISFYTLPYAFAEDQWGGECLEKNRRKLR